MCAKQSPRGPVQAVRSLSFDVRAGEVLGIVGESGSGKTVSSLAVMNLLPSHANLSGSIRFEGKELIGETDRGLSQLRGRRIAMIFQDPMSALTPVYTIGEQIAEAIRVHRDVGAAEARRRTIELLTLVGISVANLENDRAVQLTLPLDGYSRDALDRALDEIRDRFGSKAVTRAVLLGRDPGFTVPLLPD